MQEERTKDHLGDDDVVALMEGHASAEVEVHLLLCRACRELYEASVFARSAELIEVPVAGHRRRALWLSTVGVLAVAATVVFLAFLPGRGRAIDFRAILPEEMHDRVEQVSAQWMVFPGFESNADRLAPLFRSESAPAPFALDLVRGEVDRMEAGSASADDYVRGITGLVLDQELLEAWAWTSKAVESRPGDDRVWFLRALVAQRLGELDRSERILRRLCERASGQDVFCLDLLLVQVQRGDQWGARRTLQSLRQNRAAEPILSRAGQAVEEN